MERIRNLYAEYEMPVRLGLAILVLIAATYDVIMNAIEGKALLSVGFACLGIVAAIHTVFGIFKSFANIFVRYLWGTGLCLIFLSNLVHASDPTHVATQSQLAIFLLTNFDEHAPRMPAHDRELVKEASWACMVAANGGDISASIQKTSEIVANTPRAIIIDEARTRKVSQDTGNQCFELARDLRNRYPEAFRYFALTHPGTSLP